MKDNFGTCCIIDGKKRRVYKYMCESGYKLLQDTNDDSIMVVITDLLV